MICAAKVDENLFDNDTAVQPLPADADLLDAGTTAFQYDGHDLDPEVGLQYNRARHFDPTIGRWLNEDPIGFEDGANLYRYVANKPEWQNPRRPIRPTSCILTR
jgi:RHS repeat-associated protein